MNFLKFPALSSLSVVTNANRLRQHHFERKSVAPVDSKRETPPKSDFARVI
ncbi:MAG TPA: hypothetical protein VNE42_09710 [Acidimicrobiales bacterium]|nr:hypothetical protein [Acidimicrobiales bacterium]